MSGTATVGDVDGELEIPGAGPAPAPSASSLPSTGAGRGRGRGRGIPSTRGAAISARKVTMVSISWAVVFAQRARLRS